MIFIIKCMQIMYVDDKIIHIFCCRCTYNRIKVLGQLQIKQLLLKSTEYDSIIFFLESFESHILVISFRLN
jgi:hypothetical protein